MHTSIRLRLTVWYVGALALTLVALGTATYLMTRAGLYHWLDETIEERAEALSEEVRIVGGEPTLPEPQELHRSYEGADDGFAIADGSGTVVLARGLDPELIRGASGTATGRRGRPDT